MKEIYAWVPWFQELARKIDEGGEKYLIEKAKRVDWGKDNPALLRYGDENIDPFSFFYFLASKNTKNQREPVYTSVGKVFGIDSQSILSVQSLKHGFIFPTPMPLGVLFHDNANGNPDLLWRLFQQAIQSDANINVADFAGALKIKNVGVAKLTQCLFLINPHCFMPVDTGIFKFHEDFNLDSFDDVEKKINKPNGWEYYKDTLLKGFHAAFPDRAVYEINTELYSMKQQDDEEIQDRVEDQKGKYVPSNDEGQIHPLNQILYGPPGTGKTWNTVNYALAIIEGKSVKEIGKEVRDSVKQRFDELKEDGQIEMVTFHQNFAYEDFIEGIRPVLGDAAGDDSGNVQYEIVDGIFKQISDRARDNLIQSKSDSAEIDLDALLEAYADHIEERLAEEEEIKFRRSDGKIDIWITEVLRKSTGNFGITVVTRTRNGKRTTGLARQVIVRDYEKFLDGEVKSHHDIRPRWKKSIKKHPQSRFYFALYEQIKKFQDTWNPEEQQSNQLVEKLNYVLIIDEINRGNIAKIFGELITLIEDTKRIGSEDETTVTLPYSNNNDDENEAFGVPNNLYILGTMNTADRSIALLDTALRRRFDFIEMMPQANHSLISENVAGVNCRKLLARMNERISVLLDREHQIGHSYFIKVDSMEKLSNAFRNRIMPLLQEYFYDDWERIVLVLNDNGFITHTKIKDGLFKKTDAGLVDAERSVYELIGAGSDEWEKPERYIEIYKTTKQTQSDENDGE